jgi:hypothetical protein
VRKDEAVTGKTRHKRFRAAFAVVRYDGFHGAGTEPEYLFTVKEVLLTEDEADAEVDRLNAQRAARGGDPRVRYFAQHTRLKRDDAE